MNIIIEKAKQTQEGVIQNLFQFYVYEFTAYRDEIRVEEDGKYQPYDLTAYWEKENYHPYIIKVEEEIAGFALVTTESESNASHSIAEFFILKKFNRKGIGSHAARSIFRKFQGPWEVTQIATNKRAQQFWRKVIGDLTEGDYVEKVDEKGRVIQGFVL
ncbi:putative acetyltransferase [Salirhabdus euzebyi]|uniref:Putative acetyltransferase n=1 Tax=Salirhabdus euzebyi TaxID=394506 RepID=A0A841Q660_9BACI|nr:GNAT family N-acetyltransferase [Salirhabdus euzebyi]MBB6453837.1 putative acetyltransferase [Salirhabdus euzebyi]